MGIFICITEGELGGHNDSLTSCSESGRLVYMLGLDVGIAVGDE